MKELFTKTVGLGIRTLPLASVKKRPFNIIENTDSKFLNSLESTSYHKCALIKEAARSFRFHQTFPFHTNSLPKQLCHGKRSYFEIAHLVSLTSMAATLHSSACSITPSLHPSIRQPRLFHPLYSVSPKL